MFQWPCQLSGTLKISFLSGNSMSVLFLLLNGWADWASIQLEFRPWYGDGFRLKEYGSCQTKKERFQFKTEERVDKYYIAHYFYFMLRLKTKAFQWGGITLNRKEGGTNPDWCYRKLLQFDSGAGK